MSHIINYRLNQFSWAIAALLLLPLCLQGMFFDGLPMLQLREILMRSWHLMGSFLYSNYSSPFYEHPPFSFGYSIFYRLFGDQPWVDRIYPYTMYGLSVLTEEYGYCLFLRSQSLDPSTALDVNTNVFGYIKTTC